MDKVVHFEIPADDLERAKKFYESIFGWKMDTMEGMEYILIGTTPVDENGMPKEPGAINGGMMKRQRPLTSPIITINVENIDDALKNVKKMGGEVVRGKMPVADMGYAAYFKDTEGNIIGLWQKIE
ncbi:Glyoxalase/Bleomycin resistance protein/Dioxygenase superfamily protein [uncultured archaeon]|nr:Glyoxalase/Bleomycin resistance protein/Dioxygenase superfamily protein [uncultured archaeon]